MYLDSAVDLADSNMFLLMPPPSHRPGPKSEKETAESGGSGAHRHSVSSAPRMDERNRKWAGWSRITRRD